MQHHRITREELSVREYMSQVLKTLQGRRFVPFEDLFQPEKGGTVLVVTFIALLELAKGDPDRDHPGRGLCPDLRAPGLYTRLKPISRCSA